MNRHKGIEWTKVKIKLEANSLKLWSLNEMEATGGEPDVVGLDKKTGEYIFMIALRKALSVAVVIVTMMKPCNQEKKTSQRTARAKLL